MKYLRVAGLCAVAMMALMAWVSPGTASATALCSTTTTPCTSKWPMNTALSFSLVKGSSAKLTSTSGETFYTCTSSGVSGTISEAGDATHTVKGSIAKVNLTWGGCNSPTTTETGGELELHWIPGTHNGTVTAKGVTVTLELFGASCYYTAGAGVQLGTLTGSGTADAVLDVSTTVGLDKSHPNSFLCPTTAGWVASYTQTVPATNLYVREA